MRKRVEFLQIQPWPRPYHVPQTSALLVPNHRWQRWLSNPPWYNWDCQQDNMTPTTNISPYLNRQLANWAPQDAEKKHDKLIFLCPAIWHNQNKDSIWHPHKIQAISTHLVSKPLWTWFFPRNLGLVNLVWQRSYTFLIERPSITMMFCLSAQKVLLDYLRLMITNPIQPVHPPDLIFVKKFTRPDIRGKKFTH